MRGAALIAFWFGLVGTAGADVPVTGRPQQMVFNPNEVEQAEARRFAQITGQLRRFGDLDPDPQAEVRVRSIVLRLAAAANALVPERAGVAWEVHTTRNPEVDGMSMAGGKLLIGVPFIDGMTLTDSELAMVLAHEMAHVLGRHHDEALSNAFTLAFRNLPKQPVPFVGLAVSAVESDRGVLLRMGPLARMQELEADALGLLLASRAGYPLGDLVGFYEKLAAQGGAAATDSHPTGAVRLHYAKVLRQLIEAGMFGP